MVFEAIGPCFNFDCDGFDMDDEEEPPNRNAQDIFDMLRAAEEPLFSGCMTHTPLLVNTFTRNIKQKVGETSTTRNEDGFEVQERDVGSNRATEESEAQECNEDNNILTLLQNIPKEQVLNAWIDTIGGANKGRVYGLGSKTSVLAELTHVSSVHSNAPTPSTVPPQQVIETPEFEQAVNQVVDQRVDDQVDQQMDQRIELMQAHFREEIEAAVHAVMSRMFGLFPQPLGNGFGSSSQSPPHI